MSYRGVPILVGLWIVVYSYRKAISTLADIPACYFRDQSFSVYQLLWYPALFFVTYVPYVIFDIWGLLSNEKRTFMMIVLLILSHPVGFYNSVLFIIQRKLYHQSTESINDDSPAEDEIMDVECDEYDDYDEYDERDRYLSMS